MIRAFVVEDMQPILESIVQKIENHSPAVSVIGTSCDGVSALESIKSMKPDIVFTDIRMPLIDGLELISEIKKYFHNDILFIIISGYDEFEYAQQALTLGVSEFLLKPVTQESIDKVLFKAIEIVEHRKTQAEYKMIVDALNSRFVQKSNEEKDSRYGTYIILLLCAGSFMNFDVYLSNPGIVFWSTIDIKDIISSILPDYCQAWPIDGQVMNEMIVVVGVEKGNCFDSHKFADLLFNRLSGFSTPITVVTSRNIHEISQLKIENQLVRLFLQKKLIFSKSSVFQNDLSKINSSVEISIRFSLDEQKLTALSKSKNLKRFASEVLNMFSVWEINNSPQSVVKECLLKIIDICRRASSFSQAPDTYIEFEIDEILAVSTNYNLLMQEFSIIFQKYFCAPDDPAYTNYSNSLMEKVDIYIQEHYAENISINEIAEMMNMNISRLSRDFKKFKGCTPIDYVTQLKIIKAKDILNSDPNILAKDVAEILGYNNQFYFSKVFKLITGLTPSEFKNQCNSKDYKEDEK